MNSHFKNWPCHFAHTSPKRDCQPPHAKTAHFTSGALPLQPQQPCYITVYLESSNPLSMPPQTETPHPHTHGETHWCATHAKLMAHIRHPLTTEEYLVDCPNMPGGNLGHMVAMTHVARHAGMPHPNCLEQIARHTQHTHTLGNTRRGCACQLKSVHI